MAETEKGISSCQQRWCTQNEQNRLKCKIPVKLTETFLYFLVAATHSST